MSLDKKEVKEISFVLVTFSSDFEILYPKNIQKKKKPTCSPCTVIIPIIFTYFYYFFINLRIYILLFLNNLIIIFPLVLP